MNAQTAEGALYCFHRIDYCW